MIVAAGLTACAQGEADAPPAGGEPLAVQVGALDGAPTTIPYGGYVDFDGDPVNAGGVRFNFVLFPCATPGPGQCSHLWVARGTWNDAVAWTAGWPAGTGDSVTLPIFSGRFTVELGATGQNPLPDTIFDDTHETLYLGVQIEGRGLGALQKVTPAFRSNTSSQADRFRVRSEVLIDDPAGGSAGLAADGGLVVTHSSPGVASADGLGPLVAASVEATSGGLIPPRVTSAVRVAMPSPAAGTVVFDTDLGVLVTFTPGGWQPLAPGVSGTSCKAIKTARPTAPDGIYTISPDGGAPLHVECDMTHGGLTFAAFERGNKRPVAWWNMETTQPNGNVKDLVGTNDLVAQGGPTAGQPGKYGLTYRITATNQYFTSIAPFASQLVGSTPKSVSAWVNPGAISGEGNAAALGFGGAHIDASCFVISIHSGNYYFSGYNRDVDSSYQAPLGVWHHLVATYDGKLLRLYADGALVATANRTLDTKSTYAPYTVGTHSGLGATGYHWVNGLIDEPKVYDYALGPDEVMQLYTLGVRLQQD